MSARGEAVEAVAKALVRDGEVIRLGAARVAVDAAIPVLLAPIRELHREWTLQAIRGEDCVREQCDHEDECPTTGVAVCAQCFDIVRWPCATVRLLDQIEGGESR